MTTFSCVNVQNYQGRGVEYVNILYDMVKRNTTLPFNFVCLTDDPDGLAEGIKAVPAPLDLEGWWAKLFLFSPGLFPKGERIIYLDLDTLVVGNIDFLFAYRGHLLGIEDFWQPGMTQTAIMLWEAGKETIWDRWEADGRPTTEFGDGAYINRCIGSRYLQPLFPGKFCSFKGSCDPCPPKGTAIVCFHGYPHPHEVKSEYVESIWQIGGKWEGEDYHNGIVGDFKVTPDTLNDAIPIKCNTDDDIVLDQVRSACERLLPWLNVSDPHGGTAVLVGGGPSVLAYLPTIKEQSKTATIFAFNGTMGLLCDHGIPVDQFVLLEAREESTRFLDRGEAYNYLISSQCHPSAFTKVRGKRVTLWHPHYAGVQEIIGDRECALIGGGSTVGLQALSIAFALGFRNIHLYGYDSSYSTGAGHAYPQPENDNDRADEVRVNGKTFLATNWMVRQAVEFQSAAQQLAEADTVVSVHGFGLLPEIAARMAANSVQPTALAAE